MKHLITITFSMFIVAFYQNVMAQGVGIGTIVVEDDAVLQLKSPSNNQGLLIPSMTTGQRTNGWAATSGVMVYDTILKAFFYFDGANWIQLIASPAKLDINMATHKITSLASGTSAGDATRKDQQILRNGTQAFSGNQSMGSNKLTGLASGTSSADAVNRSQLNTVEDKIAYAGGITVWDARLDYPNAPQSMPLTSGVGDPEHAIQTTVVFNSTNKTKYYFCVAYLALGGSGEAEDIGVSLYNGNTMFASWRKMIRNASSNGEDLYVITGKTSVLAGQGASIRNKIKVFDDDIRYARRGMFCVSDN